MKYFTVKSLAIPFLVILLTACGGEAPPEQTAAPAAIEASSGSEAAVEATAPDTAIVEYVWHTKGDNFSDEALAESRGLQAHPHRIFSHTSVFHSSLFS